MFRGHELTQSLSFEVNILNTLALMLCQGAARIKRTSSGKGFEETVVEECTIDLFYKIVNALIKPVPNSIKIFQQDF